MIKFSEAFSYQAKDYGKYRPTYPDELFSFLSAKTYGHKDAWDCATGTGQAALGMTQYFDHIHATDCDPTQIINASPHSKVHYSIAPAESSNLPDEYVSLVTVAQSVHLFDQELFFDEVDRVLTHRGLLAAWSYSFLKADGMEELNDIIRQIRHEVLAPYIDPRFRDYWNNYQEIKFPYTEIETPQFEVTVNWTLSDLLGYIASWYATSLFQVENKGQHPARPYWTEICKCWGDDLTQKRTFRAPLALKVSQKA